MNRVIVNQLIKDLWGEHKNVTKIISIMSQIEYVTEKQVVKLLKDEIKETIESLHSMNYSRMDISKQIGVDYKRVCKLMVEMGLGKFKQKKSVYGPMDIDRVWTPEELKDFIDPKKNTFDLKYPKLEFTDLSEHSDTEEPTDINKSNDELIKAIEELTKSVKGLSRSIWAHFGKKLNQMELEL